MHNVTISMSEVKPKNKPQSETEPKRVRFTAEVSIVAYDAIIQIQRYHRWGTGKSLPRWQILDEAIVAYADKLGVKFHE